MSALTGFRVVEPAGSVAGEYCGKLLADFGAEVIKVEAPGRGSPTRAMAPVLADGCDGSALFAYLNTNKQSVELDITEPWLRELIGTADAVIADGASSGAHPTWARTPIMFSAKFWLHQQRWASYDGKTGTDRGTGDRCQQWDRRGDG
ncbi:hypothetical protein MSTO_08710 [Mycobacterium stomatepiae]|uniref:CoA transferase n=1 Tax=Mycobacterium stomatepiae TaxID=470076 RepID=A0A7I7Q3U6_9MYCO|nr:CoA transferase [Mycobacterium stomatepiae]BBY20666.1 hypothetical protein MSTO_08710 [Mycobacterium stomatepiae]